MMKISAKIVLGELNGSTDLRVVFFNKFLWESSDNFDLSRKGCNTNFYLYADLFRV